MTTNAATAAASSASAKRSKKDFEGERRSKRKTKTKSGKRRRLRDVSDSSPSSGTDEDSRPRRMRAKKSERRKRAPRNPSTKSKRSKKKASRKRRYRSLSPSSGYSGRSCSTCPSSSNLSRSPPPTKSRLKGRSRSRGRGRDEDSERGRSRRQRRRTTSNDDTRKSRYRSPSCSNCGGSRSSGPSGSRSSKKCEETEGQRQLRSKLAVEDGRQVAEVGISGNDVVSDGIIQAYDDFDRYDGRRSDNDQEFHERHDRDDWDYAIDNQLVGSTVADMQRIGNAGVGEDDFALKKSEDNSGSKVSANLESQLRQKALENFKKFQRSLSGNTRSPGHQEDEPKQSQCHNEAQNDLANTRILEWQQSIIKEVQPSKCRVRSVVKLPDEEDTSGHALRQSYSNENPGEVNNSGLDINGGQKNVVQLKRIIETANEASLVQLKKLKETSNEASLNTTPMKEKQEKNIDESSLNSITKDADMNQSSGQPTLSLPSQLNLDSGNENKEATGSQFQQKTFSRMHEGEVVQVSYKVYIPKRTPALARRQLQ